MSDSSEQIVTERTVAIPDSSLFARLDLAALKVGWSVLVAIEQPDEQQDSHTQESQQLFQLQKIHATQGALSGWDVTRRTYEGKELREPDCKLYMSEVETRPGGGDATFLSHSVVMALGMQLEIAVKNERREDTVLTLGRIVAMQTIPPACSAPPAVAEFATVRTIPIPPYPILARAA